MNQFLSSFSVAPTWKWREREKTGSMLTILVNIEPVMYSRSFASWRIWIHMIWSIWTVRCRSSIVIWMSPISIRCCSHTQVSNIKHYQIKKPPSRCQYNVPMQIPMQISNANFLCNSLFAISNAIVNANFQCKFLMQFPMQISNANFQCKFHLQFSLHFSMQFPLHTC